ncbi:ion transporter [Enemella evansiae]|uniref:Ion transporter n=1 Tax=Enemella evansiae TaxID=2016499 RepID=A0A255G491_9ACTN|nr:potassium channel family protein [Enemella evansiae]OYN98392.1 ion transporter [Enemella evansiae]OYO10730.1 ion transporter [Enemella evansiae]
MTRWERATSTPLTIAALVFLAAFAAPILWWPTPPEVVAVCSVLALLTWAAFLIDYLVRLKLAPVKRTFVRRHLMDLLAVALPMLRSLRLLRVVTILTLLDRRARLRGRVITHLVGATVLLGFCASLAVLSAERSSPEANIITFGDAVWWALSTMATVGYGDRYPVTAAGRWVGAGLMIGGVAILGTVTATISSWLIQHLDTSNEVDRLQAENAELKRRLEG